VSEQTIKTEIPGRNRRLARQFLRIGVLLAVLYLLAAYMVAPAAWRVVAHFHPALANAPHITHTKDGIPGDPLNLAVIGSEEQLTKAMNAAGWQPADPITLASSLRIVGDSVLKRPYADAPVSDLYLWGRKQDLAFEQPIGDDPRKRNHVRFWKSQEVGPLGNPMWFGAATLDSKVGLSHTTGQVTHHISPDIDAERDKLIDDLTRAGVIGPIDWENGFQTELEGHNGGGDRYETDGRLAIAVLSNR
jgi:hypothetical protein